MNYREDIIKSIDILTGRGIIIYPTDTIWGLGCDATSKEAVNKIFQIKKRVESKSLIILVNGFTMLERYIRNIPDAAQKILDVSDSPLTIIYPEGRNLAPGVCNEDGSVGIRVCYDDFCSELITRFRKPLISTSPNYSGTPAPQNFSEIDSDIIRSADYVVRYRQDETERKNPSPVIKIGIDDTIQIIRK